MKKKGTALFGRKKVERRSGGERKKKQDERAPSTKQEEFPLIRKSLLQIYLFLKKFENISPGQEQDKEATQNNI